MYSCLHIGLNLMKQTSMSKVDSYPLLLWPSMMLLETQNPQEKQEGIIN